MFWIDSPIDCGPISVEFFDDSHESIDTDLFAFETDFVVKETSDASKIGDYKIHYRISFLEYPGRYAESSEAFTISILANGVEPSQVDEDKPDPIVFDTPDWLIQL